LADQEIYLIIDGSGSMSGVKHDVAKGINEFVAEQQQEALQTGDDIVLSLTAFDNAVAEVIQKEQIDLVPTVKVTDIFFGGSTALYDAMGKTLTGAQAQKTAASKIVVVYTDGGENASKEFKLDDITKLVEELQNDGWAFIYLGAEFEDFAKEQVTRVFASSVNTSKGNIVGTFKRVSDTSTYYRGLTEDAAFAATNTAGGLLASATTAGVADWEDELVDSEEKKATS